MPASKNIPEATAEDLAWFRLDKYACLTQFKARQWARLVGDRLAIRLAIDKGNPEAISGIFESIKTKPLKWLGSDVRYIGASHAANTATVKSLNLNRLRHLSDEATPLLGSDDGDAVVDELLAGNHESDFRHYAHVMVSLDASRDQIVADFARWLDGWLAMNALPELDTRNGDYMDKAKRTWIPNRAVPLYDLDLFELMTGKSVPWSLRKGMLFPRLSEEELESKRRTAPKAAEQLFSEATLTVLRNMT